MQRRCGWLLAVLAMAGCQESAAEPMVEMERNGSVSAPANARSNGSFIVVLAPRVNARAVADEYGVVPVFVYTSALNGFAGRVSDLARARLLRDARVERVIRDEEVRLSDVQLSATWGLDRIDQPALPLDRTYTYEYTGLGVTAYIFDTGIRYDHVEFEGRAVPGFDAYDDGLNGGDCNGHGTHVAGTVGGRTYGVAKKVKLVSVRVMNCFGGGAYSAIIAGMDWVIQNKQGPAVANFSIGGPASEVLNNSIRNLINAGVQVSAAAGNEGTDACTRSPASTPEALTVAASTSADAKPSYSNWGSCVDLFAPGSSVRSSMYGTATANGTMSGTSMAAPHVTGALVLLLHENPARTPAQLHTWIREHTVKNIITGAQSANADLLQAPRGSAPPAGNTAPVAAFTSSCVELVCSFNATSSGDADGTIVSYAWTFGDGGTGTGAITNRTYAQNGSYTVTLTVTDDKGATGTRSGAVTAAAPPPVASFSFSCVAATCAFTDRSTAASGSPASWSWSFGNGLVSMQQHPTHTYASSGTYQVKLRVTDTHGGTAETVQSVAVALPAGGVALTGRGYKVKGKHRIDLSWAGASTSQVAIYRDGVLLVNTANDGAHTDATSNTGTRQYSYRLCEYGTSVCSADVTVRFE